MNIADIISSFLAYGILHLGGHGGYAGWRWLFLLEVRVHVPLISPLLMTTRDF
jgi:hypothetical protein